MMMNSNGHTKCKVYDSVYCKFGEHCRKQSFKNICHLERCNRICNSRHPKLCKSYARHPKLCKFYAEQICAYSDASCVNDEVQRNDLKKQIALLKKKIKEKCWNYKN